MKTATFKNEKDSFFFFNSKPSFLNWKGAQPFSKSKNNFGNGFFGKLFLLIFFSAFFATGHSQIPQNYLVKRGERPAINLLNVPTDAYETNLLILKFKADQSEAIEQFIQNSQKGHTSTIGIAAVDELNSKYRVRSARSYFLSPALKSIFTDRHKAWGLHLWVKLELEEDADIVEMAGTYQKLAEIELAEPVYKKYRINNVQGINDDKGKTAIFLAWTPNDPGFYEQWHFNNTGQYNGTENCDIDLPEAWAIEAGNSNVIVAVIDEGIQYTHPDLAANMWSEIGYNFVDNNSTVIPGDHATHVAGTIAATNNNGIGVSGIAGGTGSGDGVRLMSCQVFNDEDQDGFHLAPIYAADNGAAISQNSWGYYEADVYDQAILDAIDYFNVNGGGAALNGGITIFAAGNDNSSGQWYPACYTGAFAVAATNNKDEKSWYSNYDTWVDISAPGGETNSINSRGVLSTITSNNYAFYQGTSMACPHVSGTAALILSYAYGQLTNFELAELLKISADDHYEFNPFYYTGRLGSGRLNAHNAIVETENYLFHEVLNPGSFAAQALSASEIALSWDTSLAENNVLLVYANEGIFGEPKDGQNYTIGQTITGGGTVIYQGDDTGFIHTGLAESTHYYYKAFSYNDEYKYSSGRQRQAHTQCSTFSSLPYAQDFNDESSLPECWFMQDNTGKIQFWEFGTAPGLLKGTTGNYAFINSDKLGANNSQDADLISPAFDFSNYIDVYISFNHYFRAYDGSSANFYYSIDGGQSWILVNSWTATTPNPSRLSQKIESLAGKNNVRFKWNYTGSWGYYWCIDDVFISNLPINNNPNIAVNPDSFVSLVETNGTDERQLTIENNGESALYWSSIIQYGNAGAYSHAPVPEGKKTLPDHRTRLIMADKSPNESLEILKNQNDTVLKNDGNKGLTMDFLGSTKSTTANREEVILHYDGNNKSSVGLALGGGISAAARFSAEITTIYAGYKLESVDLYIKEPMNATLLRIWGAGTTTSPGALLVKQAFNPIIKSWNHIVLDNPIELDGNDIWVGFFGIHEEGKYPIGVDAGPKHPDGDWLSFDGEISWVHISDYGLNCNWNIRAHIRNDLGYNWLTISQREAVVEPGNTQTVLVKFDAKELDPGTYNANILLLNNDPQNHLHTVPVLFNVTTVGIEEQNTSLLKAFPIPATNAINVELNQEINQLRILDSKGQLIFEQSVAGKTMETIDISAFKSAVYILQYINNNGLRFNKKIVINP